MYGKKACKVKTIHHLPTVRIMTFVRNLRELGRKLSQLRLVIIHPACHLSLEHNLILQVLLHQML